MKVGDLFFALGFKADTDKLRGFDDGIKGMTASIDTSVVALGAALYAIDRFIQSSVQGAAALFNFTQQTGQSAQALQQWQAAAQLSNVALSADEVTASLSALTNNLVQIRNGAGNVSPFFRLGITPGLGDSAIQVLDKVRVAIKRFDRPNAVNILQQMGITPGMINILMKSREEFDLLSKGMVRSDATINQLNSLGMAFKKFQLNMDLFKDRAIADLAPAMIQILDVFTKFGDAIGRVYDLLREFPILTAGFALAISPIRAALVGLLTLAINPLFLALTGLFLLLEDFAVYRKGGKSVIGDALSWFGDDKNKEKLSIFPKVIKDKLAAFHDPEGPHDDIMNHVYERTANGGYSNDSSSKTINSHNNSNNTTKEEHYYIASEPLRGAEREDWIRRHKDLTPAKVLADQTGAGQ